MQPSHSFSVKGPIDWMANNAVSANLIMLACIFGGYLFIQNIKQEVFPQFQVDAVKINVAYPGASPEEIETGIILAIEDAVSGVDGIDEIRSSALEDMATVTVDAMNGVDTQILAQDLQQQVDRITTFPEDAEEPQITVLTIRRRGLTLALYGDTNESILHEIAEQFRDRLLQDPDITQVELTGVRPLEISIEVSQENLRRYHLTIADIAQRIGKSSIELPGGSIKTESGEILIRMKTRKDYGQDFARIPIITTADGTQVLLGQIANITDGYEDNDYSASYNGKPAVLVQVYSVGEQTPIQISQAVQDYVQQINPELPKGISAEILHDSSKVYQQRIDLLLRNSAMGLVLVLITLSLFLELRLAFWVMMGIPIAFLGSFLILPSLGVTLNMISLFAFIIALGIVVDDAIIIGENIYHYRQDGLPPMEAAIRGAQDMAVPVTFSILTNIATFMPLFFMPGVMGKIFFMIPTVVVTVFLISLVESLFILPNHLGHLGPIKKQGLQAWIHQKQQVFSHAFRFWVNHKYGNFLEWILNHRYLTVVAAFSLLLVTLSYAGSGRMGMSMFPKTESDYAKVTISLPYGSAIEKTKVVVQQLIKTATQVAEDSGQAKQLVKGIFADIGITGSHKAIISVYLTDPDIRNKILSTEQFTQKWRALTGNITGVDTLLFESDAGGPGAGSAITVELNHRNLDVLEKASEQLANALRAYPMVKDVDDGFSPGKQQYDFSLLAEGKSLGLDELTVGRQIRDAFYGAEVLRQQRGRNEIKIMVRLPKSERSSA
ncbi:MAG: efflux RND transporter permease subunit, partial [Methylococcales bacterium]|nr:efflux RND transporter permease subunit [Methylococcales bacterium]